MFKWIIVPCAVYFLYRLGVTRPILTARSKAGDYCYSEAGDWKDFFRSLVPRDEIQLVMTIIYLWCYLESFRYMGNFAYAQVSFRSLFGIFLLGRLVIWVVQAICAVFFFLRCELFFPCQILLLGLVLALRSMGALAWGFPQGAWNWSLDNLVLGFFLAVTYFSSWRFRAAFFPWNTSRRMRPRGFPPRVPGRKRLLLISPTAPWEFSPFISKSMYFPPVLPMVAAAVPADWDVMILDEGKNELDFELDVDVVGITAMNVYRSQVIDIAAEYRRRGRTVIVGGPDVSVAAHKYLPHFDVVFSGDAFGYLPKILADWEAGRLQKIYVNPHSHDLVGLPLPRNELLPPRRYLNMHNILVSTSCPYACEYCNYAKDRVARLRPPEEVAAAVRFSGARTFWFEAPELLAYKHYVKKLEAALRGKRIHWSTHTTVKACSDEEILRSAQRAGMRGVALGLESFSQETLAFVNKRSNKVADYLATLRLLDKAGISVAVHVIFGLPYDSPEARRAGLEILKQGRVAEIVNHVLGVGEEDVEIEKKLRAAGGEQLVLQAHLNQGKESVVRNYRWGVASDKEFNDQMEGFMNSIMSFSSIFRRIFLRSPANFPNFAPDLMSNLVRKVSQTSFVGEPFSIFRFFERAYGMPKGSAKKLAEELESALRSSVGPANYEAAPALAKSTASTSSTL